jgi:hypothetical protein
MEVGDAIVSEVGVGAAGASACCAAGTVTRHSDPHLRQGPVSEFDLRL